MSKVFSSKNTKRKINILESLKETILLYILTTYGGRSFVVGAPTLWNMLPIDLRSFTTTDTFKKTTENLAF